MSRPIDTVVYAERADTLNFVRKVLASVSLDFQRLSLADVEDQIADLEGARARVDVYVHMGDSGAFAVSKEIGDLVMRLKQWRVVLTLRSPRHKSIYVGSHHTLQRLAATELGSVGRWPEIAFVNGIRYSTELEDKVRLVIP